MNVFEKPRPGPVDKLLYRFISTDKPNEKKYKVTIKAFICQHLSKEISIFSQIRILCQKFCVHTVGNKENIGFLVG
jgi:hypothetical protein